VDVFVPGFVAILRSYRVEAFEPLVKPLSNTASAAAATSCALAISSGL